LECYDVKIHLRTNAIGMPINFNGFVPNSDRKSLEFIADRKYPTQLNNIFTQNQIEYIPEDWTISTFYMFSTYIIKMNYIFKYILKYYKINGDKL